MTTTIPLLTDETFAAATGGEPVIVCFSAPTKCPRCPQQVPHLEEAIEAGLPVYHVNVERPDSQRTASQRPPRLATMKNEDGTPGEKKMIPDYRVPAHYVYARGKPVGILTGVTSAEDLAGLYEHSRRVTALGRLGGVFWL